MERKSVWNDRDYFERRPPLEGDRTTDVLVIGAGAAGLLTALRLTQSGREVTLVDAGRTCGGATNNTTAKITAQHGLIYTRLKKQFGARAARAYAALNSRAIGEYESLVQSRGIDCGFERLANFVYSLDDERILREETLAAAEAGLDVHFVRETGLPFETVGAVKTENQAQFHPLRFFSAVARDLTIFENTRVTDFREGEACTPGGRIRARQIVFAGHYPFLNRPGYYFMRQHQERSHVLVLEGAQLPDGMFIDEKGGGLSLRRAGRYVLLGGANHRTGEPGGGYEWLAEQAQKYFPNCNIIDKFSNQDCMPIDGLPYIGRYSSRWERVYVATGFQKWGMTTAMAAADKSAMVVTLVQMAPGQARRVKLDGRRLGVYRSETGELFAVETRCPHLGCSLEWNPDERSWDCPCHGSRFDYRGRRLDGPAEQGAAKKDHL